MESMASRKPVKPPIMSFNASPELVEKTDAAAAAEGLTRASFARRALLHELARMRLVRTLFDEETAA